MSDDLKDLKEEAIKEGIFTKEEIDLLIEALGNEGALTEIKKMKDILIREMREIQGVS